ncbi:D-alanyl-D-alanine carboxypeptidase precursor [Streptomyces albidoflavus]|uniref:serine hydrolase domain-containing protein n=1 Tax=Streptomyces albidoflavus TaxID=1886 RepID=UPI000B1685AC|nr:serine hydrolase domain-containing protein [Streptomyces albidoflavus]QLP92956.1 D-alanyl-D-alanine carboxypeptidase precursor [Streptomyces albidoflavus]QLP93253.1 D-alanyl-D-alanine carboxypeptidase precursor [Streptomyces albidoflavus]
MIRHRSTRLWGLGLALALLLPPGTAAARQASDGQTAGSRRDPALQALVDQVVADPNPNPGAFLLARRGSDDRFGAAGVADRAAGTPMAPDLKFRTGSVTKTFTATVVLQLVAEHRLRLDDTVQSLLPDQVRADNALSGAPITVRQLLNHTSGLYDYIDGLLPYFRGLDQYWPRDQLIRIGLAQPRYFPAPGTRFRYSNTNYLLLDLIVERITDRDLRTNLERRVFTPLGLRDTSYPLAQTVIDGAHVHGYADVSLLLPNAPDPTRFDVTAFSPSEAGASGALVTTAADIARFYRALLRGRLLPQGLLRRMLTDTVPTTGSAPPAVAYGLGVYVYATKCGRAYGHGGSAPGYLTYVLNSRDGRDQLVAHTNWNSFAGTGIDEDFWAAFQQGYCQRPG